MSRLLKAHPDLQQKTTDAVDIVNFATVLLLQSVAKAAMRGPRKSASKTVTLEDVKQACLNNRELQFMLPLSATLDASTLAVSHHEPAEDAGNTKSAKVVPAAPGQSTLSSATFARTATAVPAEAGDAQGAGEELDVVTVQGNLEAKAKTPQQKQGAKRKLPPSAKKEKVTNKAPRQEKEPKETKAPTSHSISSFFKRTETS